MTAEKKREKVSGICRHKKLRSRRRKAILGIALRLTSVVIFPSLVFFQVFFHPQRWSFNGEVYPKSLPAALHLLAAMRS